MVKLADIEGVVPPFSLDPFRAEYPWEGRWLDREGLKLHTLDEGQGESLLFLHGNPTWSFYWRHLVAALSHNYRCVVPDHIGMGLSDKPREDRYPYTLESRVEDVAALVDYLELGDEITLVVHDWGGMIGLAWAARNPGRLRRLVLLNTAGFLLPEGRSLPWQLQLIKSLPFALPVRGLNAFVRGALRSCSKREGGLSPHVRKAYLAPYDSWANRIAVQRFVQDIPLGPEHESYALVREVEVSLEALTTLPILVCWGEQDFVFDAHFLAEWRRRLPGAEFHSFPDCGHFVLEDAPQDIAALLQNFLQKHPPTEKREMGAAS